MKKLNKTKKKATEILDRKHKNYLKQKKKEEEQRRHEEAEMNKRRRIYEYKHQL